MSATSSRRRSSSRSPRRSPRRSSSRSSSRSPRRVTLPDPVFKLKRDVTNTPVKELKLLVREYIPGAHPDLSARKQVIADWLVRNHPAHFYKGKSLAQMPAADRRSSSPRRSPTKRSRSVAGKKRSIKSASVKKRSKYLFF